MRTHPLKKGNILKLSKNMPDMSIAKLTIAGTYVPNVILLAESPWDDFFLLRSLRFIFFFFIMIQTVQNDFAVKDTSRARSPYNVSKHPSPPGVGFFCRMIGWEHDFRYLIAVQASTPCPGQILHFFN